MSMNQTDLDQLSRRFIDLWQEQWLHLVSSPETAANMGKMMEMMAPAQQMMGKFFAPETASREPSKAPPRAPAPAAAEAAPSAPSGAASLAAAFEPVARQLAVLAHRLDAIDARLNTLESPARAPRKPRAKPAPAKPARTRAKPQPRGRRKSR